MKTCHNFEKWHHRMWILYFKKKKEHMNLYVMWLCFNTFIYMIIYRSCYERNNAWNWIDATNGTQKLTQICQTNFRTYILLNAAFYLQAVNLLIITFWDMYVWLK